MNKVELKVTPRNSFGSSESRRLRRSGWVPGVLYSAGSDGQPLAVEWKALKRALAQESAIIELTFEGKKKAHPAILKEYQADPLGNGLLHVDFMEVRMDKPVESTVRLDLSGTPAGVREGGILDQSLRELQVRCLPADIPDAVHHDIESMGIGSSIKVADLAAPAGCEILNDPDTQVASIIAPRLVAEVTAEEEAAAAAGAEGEAAAEAGEAGEETEG